MSVSGNLKKKDVERMQRDHERYQCTVNTLAKETVVVPHTDGNICCVNIRLLNLTASIWPAHCNVLHSMTEKILCSVQTVKFPLTM
jgi:hypothetical protein